MILLKIATITLSEEISNEDIFAWRDIQARMFIGSSVYNICSNIKMATDWDGWELLYKKSPAKIEGVSIDISL